MMRSISAFDRKSRSIIRPDNRTCKKDFGNSLPRTEIVVFRYIPCGFSYRLKLRNKSAAVDVYWRVTRLEYAFLDSRARYSDVTPNYTLS